MERTNELRVVTVAAVLAMSFVAAIAWMPAAETSIRRACALLCHQRPERTLMLGGVPMGVCARCFGLYLGGALGLLGIAALTWRGRPYRLSRWLLAATVPTFVDALLATVLRAGAGNGLRAALAVPAGIALGLFLGEGIRALARDHADRGWRGLLRDEAAGPPSLNGEPR